MMVFYSPVRHDEPIQYDFDSNNITATYKGESVTYDVSDMPKDSEGVIVVERIDGVRPLLNIRNEDGEYWVELRHHYAADAPESERWPEWVEAT